ncbi:MAG: carbohydrate ABC transporter permease [Clostridia bacterium]|nr:carbohydrate ABC transporter permease [Clostridia bacterium]
MELTRTPKEKEPFIPKNSRIKTSTGDKIISVITYIVYALFAFVCVYPFYYVIINSISNNDLSQHGKVLFYPLEIHFQNYKSVFTLPGLLTAAKISVLRTVIGTVLTVMIAAFLGYMFTRQTMWHRKLWYRFVTVTMYINAGIIPWYLTMKILGMTNNFWGYIFPMIIQPFYIVLCKTYCESVPQALQDAAEIDGAGTIRIFFSIMLPVIKPILATIAVFAAVNQWNSFQDTLLLMSGKPELNTLQFMLYQYINQASALKALVSNSTNSTAMMASLAHAATATSIRMTVTVVVVFPIMCVYPFFQKYFTKGIMIGAVKG